MADGDDKNINNNDPNNKGGDKGGGDGGADPNGKGGGNGAGGDKNTDKPFDPTSIKDDDFSKIFDDPRAFQHPRFKKLADDAKAGRDALAAQDAAEKKRLEDEGKFKELAESEQKKREQLEQQVKQSTIDAAVVGEAAKLGAVDVDAVKALIDRANINVDESGGVTGIAEAVKALAESKGYLFKQGSGAPNLGAGNGSDNKGTGEKIAYSKVKDPAYYRENEADIIKAMQENRIDYGS